MKLTNLRPLGRFVNPETNTPVNIKKADRVCYGTTVNFFIRSGKRVFVGEEFRKWELVSKQ